MAVDVQNNGFIPQDSYTVGLHALYEPTKQVFLLSVRQAPKAIIVITKAGVDAKSAFDAAKQIYYLLSVPASKIIRYIISCQNNDVDIEQINPFKAATQIPCAYGPAVMDITDMCDAGSM